MQAESTLKFPQVIVSHPGRQYSHQTAYAFQEEGMLTRYFTSLWYKPLQFPYPLVNSLPAAIRTALLKEVKKRHSEAIQPELVTQIPIYDLMARTIRLFSQTKYNKLIYWINDQFDKKVSRLIEDIEFDAFVGYESSCLRSFRKAKSKGRLVILDLAIVHYLKQQEILSQCDYEPYEGDPRLMDEVNKRKREELELADSILVGSQFVKDSLLEAGIPEWKIFKIPYGFDECIFKSKTSYSDTGRFTVLYVGSITKRKGVHCLLEAFRELNLKSAELILIGGATGEKEILNSHNSPQVKHIPFLPHEDLVTYYQSADIFVFPSLLEGFAQTVLEAMACGTPVIVTPHTGSSDIVKDGLNGFIVPIMNVEELKEKMRFFYENRKKVEEMGRNARTTAEKYTWTRYRDEIRKAVTSIRQPSR